MTQPVDPPAGPEATRDGSVGCYRHPDRLTRIRCTRCDRPICPECMVPASVGFQCPDDVREGHKSMRAATPRTLTGARAGLRPGSITVGLIVVNVLAFLLQESQPGFTGKYLLYGYGVEQGQTYRLLTAAFLHGGITHLAVNMISLYVIGTQVERLLGTSRYLAVYLLAALGGTAASYAFQPSTVTSLGASGAVFGLLGALLVAVRRLRLDPRPLYGMLALNLALPLLVHGIDWRAHVGGLIVGTGLTFAFTYAPQDARRWVHPTSVVAALVLLVVLVQVRSSAHHSLVGSAGPQASAAGAEPFGAQGVDDLR
ncbi:MAG: hypothetical protein JWM93_2423 [Frankiales bacterium]|nr:hypothetical protein [Frankiales bacterium]